MLWQPWLCRKTCYSQLSLCLITYSFIHSFNKYIFSASYVSIVCTSSVVSNSLWPHWLECPQAPLSKEFSRQEYWSGLSSPPPGHLPHPGHTRISCTGRGILYHCTTWEAQVSRVPNYYMWTQGSKRNRALSHWACIKRNLPVRTKVSLLLFSNIFKLGVCPSEADIKLQPPHWLPV